MIEKYKERVKNIDLNKMVLFKKIFNLHNHVIFFLYFVLIVFVFTWIRNNSYYDGKRANDTIEITKLAKNIKVQLLTDCLKSKTEQECIDEVQLYLKNMKPFAIVDISKNKKSLLNYERTKPRHRDRELVYIPRYLTYVKGYPYHIFIAKHSTPNIFYTAIRSMTYSLKDIFTHIKETNIEKTLKWYKHDKIYLRSSETWIYMLISLLFLFVMKKLQPSKMDKKIKHQPKKLQEILNKFSSDKKLKYSNHTWDSSLDYTEFMQSLKDGFKIEEVEDNLKTLSPSLYQDIQKFLFLEDDEKAITWSSEIIKEEIERGVLPHNISLDTSNQSFKTFGDAIDDFKSLFVVKQNDKKLKLLKKFTKIKKELGLKSIDLNDLKKDKIDKFFTDTKRFEKALTLILKDIQENSNDDKKDIVVEADTISIDDTEMIEIKVIHVNSTSSKTAEALKETIDKNGGNFQTIYKNLISVCDWSIETICQDGKRYRIDYLYPEIDNTKPHYTQIENEIRGFTHILRFYI